MTSADDGPDLSGLSVQDTALAMVVINHMMDQLKPAQAALRTHAVELMAKKERVVARSPLDDSELGMITKSAPQAKAAVTDLKALYAWVRDTYPDKLEVTTVITGSATQVKDALALHAPELIDQVLTMPDWVVNELLLKSKAAEAPCGWGGEADVPGIVVTTPDGNVSVPANPTDMGEAIAALVRAGVVNLDGTVRALPAANPTTTSTEGVVQ